MHCKELFWSNVLVLLYSLALCIVLYSFRVTNPPSNNTSSVIIPSPCLFDEFIYNNTNNTNLSDKDNLSLSRWIDNRHYKRLVLILLDAFRLDYIINDPLLSQDDPRWVYTNKMNKFTSKLDKIGNKGRLFRFKAEIPTTTIARVKSILTGHSQAYLDITDNNNPQFLETDNILKQLLLQDRKIVIMGDSLWDTLQKGTAIRSYTATGLNIHDNTADTEVFHHFFDELTKSDWDVIIGHLIGVDHFGHAHGIENSAISNMLISYDNFVDKVLETILTKEYQDTLLVIFSDHGVNADGTHGGKTPEEVDAFMAMFNYNGFAENDKSIEHLLLCHETNFLQGYRQKHNVLNGKLAGKLFHWASQIDMAPTLALLMGFPIPYNSKGRILYESFPNSPHTLIIPGSKRSHHLNKLLSNQRYYSQLCHVNLYSLLRNYFEKEDFNLEHSYSVDRKRLFIMRNLFKLNKLYHMLLIFANPNSVTFGNSRFHKNLLKSHLSLCNKITYHLSDSSIDTYKVDYFTMLILLFLLALSILELIDWATICKIISKGRFKLLLASLTMFFCFIFLGNPLGFNFIVHNLYFNLTISIVVPMIFYIIWNHFTIPRIDFSASTFSSAITLINGFYIPELLVITFHVLTPFFESLSIQAPSCYTSLLVYLIVHNLLPLEDWKYRLESFSEATKNPGFFNLLNKCHFLLKPFTICTLIKVLNRGHFKYISNFRWWCKLTHFHPVPLLSLSLIYRILKNNPLLLDYDLKLEWIMWTVQTILTSFYLSYNHGEMINLCYISSKIVFIISGLMILLVLLRPLKSESNHPLSKTSYKLNTISIHLIWPAYLLYGPSQSINLLLCIIIEKLFFEVVKYTIKDSMNYTVSPIRFAIVYIFLGEHFYYSTEHSNSFFTLPFEAAYTLTGSYTRFLSEFLIGYHVFFSTLLSTIQFMLTLINYKAHLIIYHQTNNSMTISNVVTRLSFGVYLYILCSAIILTIVKTDKLFYTIFLPSTLFTVSRTAVFVFVSRVLFNIIDISSDI